MGLLLPGAAAAHTRPRYGGTVRVEVQGDAWASDSMARRMVYDSLTRADGSGETKPGLAMRWEGSNNAHRWQFWIRAGVRFHDGSALTAEAVVDSLNRSCSQSCPWTAVRRSGDSVVFTLASADTVFPAELGSSEWAIAGPEVVGAPAAGTGAFRLVSSANGTVTLGAVDDAWAGRPFVDQIQIAGRKAIRSQVLDLASGQADLIEVPAELVRQMQQERLRVVQSSLCDLLVLSVSRAGALADDAQRESVALAVDRPALANTVFQKQGEMSANLLPNSLSGFAFLFPVARDVARAQMLHGSSGGAVLTWSVEDGGAAAQLAAERIALNLHDAGFRVQVLPHGSVTTRSPGADLTLRRVHVEAAESGAVLREVVRTLGGAVVVDADDPGSLYRAEATVLQTHTMIPLLWLPRSFGVGTRVRGLHLMADGTPELGDVSLEDAR